MRAVKRGLAICCPKLHYAVMTRTFILAVASVLSGCSGEASQTLDDQANDLLNWSKRNPAVSVSTWRGTSKLVCRPKRLDVCDGEKCIPRMIEGKPPVIIQWKPQSREYLRCDPQGSDCNTYRPTISYSGSFMQAALPENGVMFWLTASGEYREIANMWTNTYVYRGECSTG